MNAVHIYQMLPQGNKSFGGILPSNERQVRALGRLPTLEAQIGAWEALVVAAGKNPIRTRDVEKVVGVWLKCMGLGRPASQKPDPAKPKYHQISAADLAKIQRRLDKMRKAISAVKDQPGIEPIIDEIEGLLPPS